MVSLSESYAKTLALLKSDKTKEATDEFRKGFAAVTKTLYAEVAQTYPTRYSKVSEWCAWVKQYYVLTRRVESGLVANRKDGALQDLTAIRNHFHQLHAMAQLHKCNDWIHEFRTEAAKAAPSVSHMKGLRARLDTALPSAKAKAELEAYQQAKSAWAGQVDPLLSDEALTSDELVTLRKATEDFYQAYGIQFE